jgi:hypothetical protein
MDLRRMISVLRGTLLVARLSAAMNFVRQEPSLVANQMANPNHLSHEYVCGACFRFSMPRTLTRHQGTPAIHPFSAACMPGGCACLAPEDAP